MKGSSPVHTFCYLLRSALARMEECVSHEKQHTNSKCDILFS